jgi:hypothetical protein
MISRRDKRALGRRVDRLIKNEIRRQGLVRTGRMVGSIKTTILNSTNQMRIDVDGVDYLKYVDGNYDIIKRVQRGRKYKEIEEDFDKLNNN